MLGAFGAHHKMTSLTALYWCCSEISLRTSFPAPGTVWAPLAQKDMGSEAEKHHNFVVLNFDMCTTEAIRAAQSLPATFYGKIFDVV